ncbi:hypothetical protein HanPI659440_Chr04g0153981 [Helianthus annuus]|nr:hypothetical protein HanPI659440_Chr04g0153981 [Helianthus annuus]
MKRVRDDVYSSSQFKRAFVPPRGDMYGFSVLERVFVDSCDLRGICIFYVVLKTPFILLEVALIMFIAFDHHWESDLPLDPTGAIYKCREFVESDVDFCKWIGSAVVVVQMKLDEDDIEEDVRCNAWEPLLNPHVAQTSVSVRVNGKSFHSDIWSSRMREKVIF